jgi:hypothetical protein
MSQFLDMLKERLVDAQRRIQVTQVQLQQAQAHHQAMMQEVTSLQTLVSVETQREQLELQKRAQSQNQPRPSTPPAAALPAPSATTPPAVTPVVPHTEVNKAEIIREVLRQHPNGITPSELWAKVRDQVERPYIYAVLKRMKDKKQVTERRGKYYLPLTPKSEEGKEGSIVP